jgi:hypothetical protein
VQTRAPHDSVLRFLACVAILLTGLHLAPCVAAGPRPRLKIDNPARDFGRIPNGSDLEYVYPLRNVGDADLHLRQVRASCPECLIAYAEPAVLGPGQQGGIVCTFDPRFLSGPVTREIYVESNDPDVPVAVLTLQAWVEPVFEIPSGGFRLGPAPAERQVRILVRAIDPSFTNTLRILSVTDGIEAKIESLGDRRHSLTAHLVEPIARGRRVVRMVVGTGRPGDATCLLVGELHNPDDLELIPEALDFLPVAGLQRRTLWVHQPGAEPMELVAVQASRGDFRIEVEPMRRPGDYRVQVAASGFQNTQGELLSLDLRFRDRQGVSRERRVPIRSQTLGETPHSDAGIGIANPSQHDPRPKATP